MNDFFLNVYPVVFSKVAHRVEIAEAHDPGGVVPVKYQEIAEIQSASYHVEFIAGVFRMSDGLVVDCAGRLQIDCDDAICLFFESHTDREIVRRRCIFYRR